MRIGLANHQEFICGKGVSMSKVRISMIAAFLVLALGAAFAASNSTQITLGSATTVAGQKLAPGTYKVTWTGQGDNLTVVLKGNNAEVTAPAKAVKNTSRQAATSIVTNKNGDLTEIRPAGKDSTISFAAENGGAAGSPSSAQ
jgi:hypothetical protein